LHDHKDEKYKKNQEQIKKSGWAAFESKNPPKTKVGGWKNKNFSDDP